MAFLSEADIESALLSYFADLGYAVEREENIGPDGKRRNGKAMIWSFCAGA